MLIQKRKNLILKLSLSLIIVFSLLYLFSFIPGAADVIDRWICLPVRYALALLYYPFSVAVFELIVAFLPLIIVFLLLLIRKGAICIPTIIMTVLVVNYISVLAVPAKREKIYQPPTHIEAVFSDAAGVVSALLVNEKREATDPTDREQLYRKSEQLAAKQAEKLKISKALILPRIKKTVFSDFLSRMGVYGYLAFPTGELIISTDIPTVMIPLTTAHETLHFLGVSREDDAELLSYICCSLSDDPFIRYSAYLYAYRRITKVLYRTEREIYRSLISSLPEDVSTDLSLCQEYDDRYRSSGLRALSARLNDAAVSVRDNRGGKSYSDSVILIADYILCTS